MESECKGVCICKGEGSKRRGREVREGQYNGGGYGWYVARYSMVGME